MKNEKKLNCYAFMGVNIFSNLPDSLMEEAIMSVYTTPEFLEWHRKEIKRQFEDSQKD